MTQPDIVRKGIERQEGSEAIEVHLVVGGVAGRVTFKECFFFHALHGPWASHSGYRSLHFGYEDEPMSQWSAEQLYELAGEMATERFMEESAFAFLVGDEHRDCGWRKISQSMDGRVQIRLPDWHSGVLAACLESYGVKLECPLNNYWVFEHGVTKEEARAILKPALQRRTRFADEESLAREINACATDLGYVKGEPLSSGHIQGSLF